MMADGVLIALDWGTTNVRAALLDGGGNKLDERRGESGVGHFSPDQFAARFDELVSGWPNAPAIAAGMIGSRQGWIEAEYLAVPATTKALAQALVSFAHNDRMVTIVPGLKFEDGQRFDVMRGEESQLAGLLATDPTFSGTVIMPGTHSKWVRLESGVIDGFQTYMTGELFDVISEHTILRHSVSATDGSDQHFKTKVRELAQNPASLEGSLFGLRARHLLDSCDQGRLRQELSASLIMAELRAGAHDGFSLDSPVVLVGTEALTAHYETALTALEHGSRRIKGTSLVWPALFELARQANLIEELIA